MFVRLWVRDVRRLPPTPRLASVMRGWTSLAVTGAAAALLLTTRINPLWLLAGAAALGGLGAL